MRITMNDGVGLAVDVAGDGPGLLLVHGLGGAKEDFADHVATLAQDHTVVIFDHRGHGASDKPTDPAAYSFARLVDDTVAVADGVGLDRFRLLGHSMGGMVARKIALHEPSRVDALVMMDTSAGPVPGFDPTLVDLAVGVALNDGKAALKELLDMVNVLESPAHKQIVAKRPGYSEFEDRKWADLSEIGWATLLHELAYQTDDLPAMAASLHVPLLVLVGEQDEPFVIASHAMADAIAGTQLVVIADAGHSPQFENPHAWITALTRFLSALPATAL
ncbi:MAG TPA: alpha/beta hydrolase [Acidimicrobiia bacterium]|jgi:pimeloyl-ACP methyl ester carboxylesterase|nr:alpha/beta hydrolase [Acidimicrobiia bacterium]